MHVYLNKTINIKIIIVAFPLQGIMWPQVITGILANLINALLNYIFIFPLKMGIQWVSPSLPRTTLSRTLFALPHEIICDHSSFAEDLPLPTRCPRPPCLCCSSCTLFAEVSTRPLGEVSSLTRSWFMTHAFDETALQFLWHVWESRQWASFFPLRFHVKNTDVATQECWREF